MRPARIGWLVVALIAAGCGGAQVASESAEATESPSEAAAPTASASASATDATAEDEQIAVAEEMIDAFYAFDPDPLAEILSSAGRSQDEILAYQAWAEGGNYKVLERPGCEVIRPDVVECPVTVEDDLLLALGSDFKVTDVFTLTFEGTEVVSVTTGSDDPEVVHQAFGWVMETYPELSEEECATDDQGVQVTPGDCIRAVVAGFKEFAESADFPGAP